MVYPEEPKEKKSIDLSAWLKWIGVGLVLIFGHFGYHLVL